MKKLVIFKLFVVLFIVLFISCNKETNNNSKSSCGYYTYSNGTTTPVYKGSNNGCYYINSNGNKTYVDDNYCCN